MMRRLALALLLLAFCALPAEAVSCAIQSATGIAFSNYTGAMIEVTGTVTVKCTGNATFDIGLSAGTGSGATETNRSMTGSAPPLLGYGLYSDATYTTNWGDTSTTRVPKTVNNSSAQTYTIYAKLPAAQYPTLGSYVDSTITATAYVNGVATGTTASFSVTATVLKDCVVSATNMVFGNYTGAVNNTTSTITVTCTNTATYTVGLNQGTTSGGAVTARLMAGQGAAAGQTLAYALTSVSYTGTNWGNTSPAWVSGTGTGAAQPLTVYGQVAAGQHPKPGSYTDTITATVTY
jgi:spore coat protein U-like protein